jgi:hypothetical protein
MERRERERGRERELRGSSLHVWSILSELVLLPEHVISHIRHPHNMTRNTLDILQGDVPSLTGRDFTAAIFSIYHLLCLSECVSALCHGDELLLYYRHHLDWSRTKWLFCFLHLYYQISLFPSWHVIILTVQAILITAWDSTTGGDYG